MVSGFGCWDRIVGRFGWNSGEVWVLGVGRFTAEFWGVWRRGAQSFYFIFGGG